MPAFAKENGGTLTATQIQVLVHEIKGIPYRIVAKQEGGRQVRRVVADAGGISPKWGCLAEPPAACRAIAIQQAPTTAAVRKRVAGCSRLRAEPAPSVMASSGAGHRARASDRSAPSTTRRSCRSCSDQVLRRYVITGTAGPRHAELCGRRVRATRISAADRAKRSPTWSLCLASWRRQTAVHSDCKG